MSVADNAQRYSRLRDEQSSLFELYARRNGLTGKSLLVLLWLYHSPQGLSQEFIAKRTYSTKQVIRSIIKNLQAETYIILELSKKDRRKKIVRLTDYGRRYASSLADPLARYEQEAMAVLSQEQQEVLLEATAVFSHKLRQILEEREV
ncbi:MarR family winged helix-turn-helix transcriptional regulator [Streptococcus dentapri]|uniref:MarR family winged helix-turn-helix transcriptional regulator n=1 Tax=Streptococcus dentapri TaxID=573564 RepID=A0ABV8D2M8_9STRE